MKNNTYQQVEQRGDENLFFPTLLLLKKLLPYITSVLLINLNQYIKNLFCKYISL